MLVGRGRFWVVSIFDAVLLIFYSLVLRESYAPVLLAKEAKHLRKTTGRNYQTKFERMHPTFRKNISVSVVRPLKLLVTRPIIHFISILLAYNFGVYVVALSTFSAIYSTRYHKSETAGGLHYIAIAVGSTIATQLGGPLIDRVWAHLKKKSGNVVPEFRVPLMIPGAVMMPAGLFIYGWAAEKEVAWIVVDIGAAIFSGGVQIGSNAMFAYLIDEFGEHSASANASARALSMAMGFGFPLFAPQLYETLGYGWGNSLLSFLYIAIGIPAPLLLWKWGAKIRAIGRPK
jgi:nitrate/nitrite transporter NarK